jgi:hypothetical protein
VVLHAGIASALRVLQPDLKSSPFYDIYRNVDLLPRVPAPVFVVHGVADVEIPLAHGQALARAARCQFPPWWVEGAGHNDIEVEHRAQWLAHLDEFVRYVEQTTPAREECDDPTHNHPGRGKTTKGKQEHNNKNGQQQHAAAAAAARMSIEMQPLNHNHRRKGNDEGVASGAPAAAAAAASSVPPSSAAALSAAPSFSLSSASSASSMDLLSPEQQHHLGAQEEHEEGLGSDSAEPLAANARRAGPVPSPSMEVQFADAHAAPSPSVERQAADGRVASALDAV